MVVKSMRRMRIGQVGVRVDFFWTTIANESELLEKFGIQVLPFDMVDFLRGVKARARKDRAGYVEELAGLKREWLDLAGMQSEEGVLNALAYRDELFRLGEENDLDAFSIKSFSSIPDELGAGTGIGEMMLKEWYPVGVESDLHGAISSVLVEAAAAEEQPSFLPEYTMRHPDNDNAVLLWHGVAPRSLRHPGAPKIRVGAPWILKGLPPSSPRSGSATGRSRCAGSTATPAATGSASAQGRTVPGPATREFYAWMEVDDWPRWERRIMQGPYIHHCSAVYDHCADVLEEACRYIPHLVVERFDQPADRRVTDGSGTALRPVPAAPRRAPRGHRTVLERPIGLHGRPASGRSPLGRVQLGRRGVPEQPPPPRVRAPFPWSDELPHLQAWFGTGVYANAFGCEYLWREGEAPDSHVRYHHIEEVRGLPRPDWRGSPVMRMVLDCIDVLKERTRGRIPIALTDTQSPFDTATLVLDTSEFFTACYTEEETAHELMNTIADLVIEFSREQARHIGDELVSRPGHVMPSLPGFRGITLSDDNLAVSSPLINERFSLPCNQRIADALGGVAVHSCGAWDHTMKLLPGRGVMGIDCAVSREPPIPPR